jgi:phospholipid/cholesterol/gamma-HCH transport system substrate-binding protein
LKITREIKTAILVITAICFFIWGYSFLKGENLFNNHTKLYVDYDNVEGLAESAPVTISGKIIGKVSSIKLGSTGKLLVEIQVDDENSFISKSSVAEIYEPGFIGGKQIAIIPNYKDSNKIKSGDHLMSNIKIGMLSNFGEKLEPTQQKINKLLVNADGLMGNLNDVLDAQTKQNQQKQQIL